MKNKYLYNVILTIIFVFALLLILNTISNKRLETKTMITEGQVDQLLTIVDSNLDVIIEEIYSDLNLINSSPDFIDFLETSEDSHLIDLITNIALQNEDYHQIRYIDSNGNEIIRLDNYDEIIYKDSIDLQNKSERDYFIETSNLPQNSFYVSKLGFNIENGVVTVPLEPVIRFAVPVYLDGEQKGVLVINFDGIVFLDMLQQNVDYFDFELNIGILDHTEYWSTSNDVLDRSLHFVTIAEQPNSIVFTFDGYDGIKTVEDNKYHSKRISFEIPNVSQVETSSNELQLLASYNLDDVKIVNFTVLDNPIYKYGFIVILSILFNFLLYAFSIKFDYVRVGKIYSFVSEFSQDGILVTDSKKNTLHSNKVFNAMYGVTTENIAGRYVKKIISADHRILNPKSKTSSKGFVWNINANGIYVLLKIRIENIQNYFGKTLNYVALYKPLKKFHVGINDIENKKDSVFNYLVIDFLEKQITKSYLGKNISILLLEPKSDTIVQYQDRIVYSHFESSSKIISANYNVLDTYYISNKTAVFIVEIPENKNLKQITNFLSSSLLEDSTLGEKNYILAKQIDKKNIEDSLQISFLMLELTKISDSKLSKSKPELYDAFRRHYKIINLLEGNLSDINFYLDYQSQRNVKTSAICGVEALIRIKDPELGYISPGEFIPVIEKMKRNKELLPIIINTVLKDLKRFSPSDINDLKVSINLSADDLEINNIVTNIINPIMNSDFDPAIFGFEITETTMVAEISKAETAMVLLKSTGFRTILDDFGTGYSSLSYVNQLNFDVIKIDRHFITDSGDKTQKILKTMVTLCELLKVTSVIEGVETKSQLKAAKDLDIDIYQGFYDSIPKSLDKVIDDYKNNTTTNNGKE